MIKDTNEQPDEKIHRMRPERIPNAGVVVSHECVCQPRSPLDPVLWDLMEVSSCRHGQLLSTVWIPPTPLSGRWGVELLITPWSFWNHINTDLSTISASNEIPSLRLKFSFFKSKVKNLLSSYIQHCCWKVWNYIYFLFLFKWSVSSSWKTRAFLLLYVLKRVWICLFWFYLLLFGTTQIILNLECS